LNEAIDRAEDQDIRNLQENLARAKGMIARKEITADVYFGFHSLFATSLKNTVFVILEGAVNAIHRDLRIRSSLNFRRTKTVAQVHEQILDVLVKKSVIALLICLRNICGQFASLSQNQLAF